MATPARRPANHPPRPFDRDAALADLRTLGRHLDRQVTTGTAATTAELDATLAAMSAVHGRLTTALGRDLAAAAPLAGQ
ncbi:hypothetical protein OG455_01725 [Kitasatospora sp. NBC_01287]|uniref:hypothetical protein n=1 Tax=Kitasatospora sp. NBC_01287 TaxID=2903573 RepID=UPI00224F86DA|nr:hypothetical protein [Kitasatospora sp. NBC_01287]MCX4744243.1 hypothetical protein [Kitasatospora sp. NBC_01287]